jgi:DNA uptake protein ComE-like DNA-binding protein
VGDLVVWGVLGGTSPNPDGSNTPLQNMCVLLTFVLAVLGTIHAFRVRDEVFGTLRVANPVAGMSAGLDPAVANSLAARTRRAESVALSGKDPGLARDLRIGRPDLARQYDDGGLVDVNHVPEAFLVSHLGLTPDQARKVIKAREHIGGFQSPTELCGLAELPPKTLDAIRDRIVTL